MKPHLSISIVRPTKPQPALHRIHELLRIEPDAALEHGFDATDIRDRRRRVAGDDDQVRLLAGGDRADARVAAEVLRAVQRADRDRFERREARFDQQLDLPLIRVAGNDAAAIRSDRCRRCSSPPARANARSSASAFGNSFV